MAHRTIQRVIAAAAAVLPGAAAVHPGHGLDPSGASWWHVLAEPEHALPLLAVACAIALALALGLRARRRQPQ